MRADGEAARAVKPCAEVQVCDLDREAGLLVGVDGRSFREVATNLWAPVDGVQDLIYLGTGRHGAGITLKPLFMLIDGAWRNVTTGRLAPLSTLPGAQPFDEGR